MNRSRKRNALPYSRDPEKAGAIRIQLLLVLSSLLLLCGASCRQEVSGVEKTHVRYVIGLSPYLDESVKDEVFRQIVRFLLEDAPLDSSLWIYDAYHIRTVAQIEIPKSRAFRSAKTRANQFKERIHEVKTFLAASPDRPETAGLNLDQAIRSPQFLQFVGENLAGPKHSVVVILLGSPLYIDEKEPGFSMVQGYFPSDGHLLAIREKSVFGIKDRTNALNRITVHSGYFGDPWMSEIHHERISRFWTLFLKGQGGRLATFCGDLRTVFNAIRAEPEGSPSREQQYEIDPSQTKVEMLRITRDLGVADWITRDVPLNLAQRPPSGTVGPMKIGIRWQGNIDLDLYARPSRDAETLFFDHVRSADGYYFKDHRSSPDREYEFIEFLSPVDIWRADVHVNFYEGVASGGPEGEVRVEFEGRIYSGRFSLPAKRGNRGAAGGTQNDCWATIDLPRILRMR